MYWLFIVIAQLLYIVAMLIGRHYTTFKVLTLDKVLYNFREMRFEATILLTDNLRDNIGSHQENKELSAFIVLTTNTVDHFDDLKSNLFKFKGFLYLFRKIDGSFQKLETTNLGNNQHTHRFKEEFIENLYLAFDTVPFFQLRLVVFLASASVKFLSASSFKKIFGDIQDLQQMVEHYSLIKKGRPVSGPHSMYSAN